LIMRYRRFSDITNIETLLFSNHEKITITH
jgi:hypothetical protein